MNKGDILVVEDVYSTGDARSEQWWQKRRVFFIFL
jgi:hypothetical protein